MLVIEGYTGKSLVVAQLLVESEMGEKILIVDREHMNLNAVMTNMVRATIYNIRLTDDYNIDKFIKSFKEEAKEYLNVGAFTKVILYLNTTNEHIGKFKVLEDEIGVDLVLTIQVHDRDSQNEIKRYSV